MLAEKLDSLQKNVTDAYMTQSPTEILPNDMANKNPSEIRKFVFDEVDRISAGLGPDEIKIFCLRGDLNRFLIGGENMQGLVDLKILAGRAIDMISQQPSSAKA